MATLKKYVTHAEANGGGWVPLVFGRICIFDPLVDHPAVLKVVALSGGFARAEACAELAKNRGVIASFSRALLDDLRHAMSDDEFAGSLGGAIDEILCGFGGLERLRRT